MQFRMLHNEELWWLLTRLRSRMEDKIKMLLREIGYVVGK